MSLKDAFENPEAIKQRQLEHRRAIWSRIKSEHPENAEFIELVTARFGKPERMTTTLPDGTVLDSLGYSKGGVA
jgi:hypothetical protein